MVFEHSFYEASSDITTFKESELAGFNKTDPE